MPDIGGRRFSNGDTLIGGALIVAFVAVFLPWYSASFNCGGIPGCGGFNTSSSVGALSFWTGWLFFLAVLAGLALFVIRVFVPSVTLPTMPQPDAVLFMVVGAFMLLMGLLWLLTYGGASASGPGYSAGPSFGLFIGLIAAVGVIAGGFLKRSEPDSATRTLPVSSGTMYGGPPSSPPPPPTA